MKFNKQIIRNRISNYSSYVEICMSIFILVGIVLMSTRVFFDIETVILNIRNPELYVETEVFLSHAFELIIGVELVKMLVKHTANSTIEVLVFAIARQVVINHDNITDVLIGVIAICLLFVIRQLISNRGSETLSDEHVLNAGFSINELFKEYKVDIKGVDGNTVAGMIANYAKKMGESVYPGYKMKNEKVVFEVYAMDANLIKQVKMYNEAG